MATTHRHLTGIYNHLPTSLSNLFLASFADTLGASAFFLLFFQRKGKHLLRGHLALDVRLDGYRRIHPHPLPAIVHPVLVEPVPCFAHALCLLLCVECRRVSLHYTRQLL